MWPFKKPSSYAEACSADLYRAIVSTWKQETLEAIPFENDDRAAQRFLFSSYIQGMIFYGTTEFEAPTGAASFRSMQVIAAMASRFLNADQGVTIGDYIVGPHEKFELPSLLEAALGMKCNRADQLSQMIQLSDLIAVVYNLRLKAYLEAYSERYNKYGMHPYDCELQASPFFIQLGVSMTWAIFQENLATDSKLREDYRSEYARAQMMRSAVLRNHCKDLFNAVLPVVRFHS